jgi:hypothetical protein
MRRAKKLFCILVCRLEHARAAQPTLVVKMSDTSLPGKAGSNPAFDARAPGGGQAKVRYAPRREVFPKGKSS